MAILIDQVKPPPALTVCSNDRSDARTKQEQSHYPNAQKHKRWEHQPEAAESRRFSTKPPAINGALASLGLKHLQLTHIRHPRERASAGHAASTR
jgi:hypothetical protein